MFKTDLKWRNRLIIIGAALVVLIAVLSSVAWYKFYREEPEQQFSSLVERFKYGSIGAENSAGLPYWIWVVLPRVFPDLLPGSGGYRSLGIVWEEGHEMPVGFTKRVIGFPRVANNCAACHTATYRTKSNQSPTYVPAGPGHTFDVQGYFRFFTNCANDVRFNPDTLLTEIELHANLSWFDKLSYRYLIIPRTRTAILRRSKQLAWINRPFVPDWGGGRDDRMSLAEFFVTSLPVDDRVGSADSPSAWNLAERQGMNLNWGGETPSLKSVIIDSTIGLQADPRTALNHVAWIEQFLHTAQAPKYPFPIDAALAAKGEVTYKQAGCYSCHALAPGTRTGTVIDISEVKTDRNRLDTWTAETVKIVNEKAAGLGIQRINMIKTNGYQAVPLDGLWLRAPYLHNGSVPSLQDLLKPEDQRTRIFWRGYDVYDPANVGFDLQLNVREEDRVGFRFDTGLRGNGNRGHTYGTTLSAADKAALIEYLKTL